jgi:hypothetical protein
MQFSPFDVIKRLPTGTTILDAKLRVKMTGLEGYYWNWNSTTVYNGGPATDYVNTTISINGETLYTVVDNVITYYNAELELMQPRGLVSFRFIGAVKNTSYIEDWTGANMGVESYDVISSTGVSISSEFTNIEDDEWTICNCTGAIQSLMGLVDSEANTFYLWPSVGSPNSESSIGRLASYAESLLPDGQVSFSAIDDFTYSVSSNLSGRLISWDNLYIGSLYFRFRLPSGIIDEKTIPIMTPPAI